jgi:hypothetical protein
MPRVHAALRRLHLPLHRRPLSLPHGADDAGGADTRAPRRGTRIDEGHAYILQGTAPLLRRATLVLCVHPAETSRTVLSYAM